jgi:hypothetical protein
MEPLRFSTKNGLDSFLAHGDWESCLQSIAKAERLLARKKHTGVLDGLYDTRLTCLSALGRRHQAITEGRAILRKHPNLKITRAVLGSIESGDLKVEPWAPRKALYLKELRQLAT